MVKSTQSIGELPFVQKLLHDPLAVETANSHFFVGRVVEPSMKVLLRIQSKTVGDVLQALDRMHVTACGNPHEGGIHNIGLNPETCYSRDGNLACSHPELGMDGELSTYVWLANNLGILEKGNDGSPSESAVLQRQLYENSESKNGSQKLDFAARYLYRNDPDVQGKVPLHILDKFPDPQNAPADERMAFMKKEQGRVGNDMSAIRNRLFDAFTAAVEPPSLYERALKRVRDAWSSTFKKDVRVLGRRERAKAESLFHKDVTDAIERYRTATEKTSATAFAEMKSCIEERVGSDAYGPELYTLLLNRKLSQYETLAISLVKRKPNDEHRPEMQKHLRQWQDQTLFHAFRHAYETGGLSTKEASQRARADTRLLRDAGMIDADKDA